jgi:hypothetical protein
MLKVIYRMCGIKSTNPSPIYQENKFKLNELCLKSFIGAFVDVKPEVHFLLDFCGEEYKQMVDEVCPFKKTWEFTKLGINGTMLRAYEIAAEAEDYILMNECDYLWVPQTGKLFLEALRELDIVSPYDHLNFYIDKKIHLETCEIKLINGYHFRTTERNTMTWGTHSKTINQYYDYFVRYGYLDDLIWQDLALEGIKLWVPVPSMATHLCKNFMAPSVNWEKTWKKYL